MFGRYMNEIHFSKLKQTLRSTCPFPNHTHTHTKKKEKHNNNISNKVQSMSSLPDESKFYPPGSINLQSRFTFFKKLFPLGRCNCMWLTAS